MRPRKDAHLKYTDDDRVNMGNGSWLFVELYIPPVGSKKKIIASLYREMKLPDFQRDENGEMQMIFGAGATVIKGLLLNQVELIFR